jgi:hypothetical protein
LRSLTAHEYRAPVWTTLDGPILFLMEVREVAGDEAGQVPVEGEPDGRVGCGKCRVEVVGDATGAAVMIDRLVHHAEVLTVNGTKSLG